jgi:hypothetical protein
VIGALLRRLLGRDGGRPKPTPAPNIRPGWPAYPSDDAAAEYGKIVYQAEVDLAKEPLGRDEALYTKERTTEADLFRDLQDRIREVAAGRAGRRDALAETVQKASAAIVTLYTGLLGLVFAAGDRQLPARGLIPAVFLGAAVALATAYSAFVVTPRTVGFPGGSIPRASAWSQTRGFVTWIYASVQRERWLIRAAVLALAAGLAFLPAPFVTAATSSEPGAPPVTAWPAVPPVTDPAQASLELVLFKAQVDEASAARAAEARPNAAGDARIDATAFLAAVWTAAGIALFLVALSIWEAVAASRRRDGVDSDVTAGDSAALPRAP